MEFSGFRSKAEAWLDNYEDPTFEQQIESTVQQLLPLYEQLHAYVRYQLGKQYGKEEVSEKGPIPMHLTGSFWSQQWEDVKKKIFIQFKIIFLKKSPQIADFTMPYPEKPLINITNEMIKQNYTALRMFQMGDDFFRSLNMTALPQ
jgi:peptidyl-dipeptidase A